MLVGTECIFTSRALQSSRRQRAAVYSLQIIFGCSGGLINNTFVKYY